MGVSPCMETSIYQHMLVWILYVTPPPDLLPPAAIRKIWKWHQGFFPLSRSGHWVLHSTWFSHSQKKHLWCQTLLLDVVGASSAPFQLKTQRGMAWATGTAQVALWPWRWLAGNVGMRGWHWGNVPRLHPVMCVGNPVGAQHLPLKTSDRGSPTPFRSGAKLGRYWAFQNSHKMPWILLFEVVVNHVKTTKKRMDVARGSHMSSPFRGILWYDPSNLGR